ncbi:MAG: glycosyltransferase [Eggerthella lenta]
MVQSKRINGKKMRAFDPAESTHRSIAGLNAGLKAYARRGSNYGILRYMDTSIYINNLNVLVVIPAYSEQESIVSVVDVVSAGYDYVVVNDGSPDETQSLCESHRFNVLNLPQNLSDDRASGSSTLLSSRR